MANTYRIQVITKEFVPEVGTEYVDAQYFDVPANMTIEQFKASNESTINAEKATRIANYVDAVKNPPKPVEPTKEQLEAEAQSIADQKVALDQRLSDIAIALVDAKSEIISEKVIP